MATFTKQTRIDASEDKVWDVLADIGSISKWNPGVKHSYLTSDAATGEGATRHCDLQRPGGKRIGYLEERAFDWREGEAFRISIDETNLPLKTNVVSFVVRGNGEETVVAVSPEYEVKYGVLGKVMDSLIGRRQFEKGMENLLRGLKHYIETGDGVGDRIPENSSSQRQRGSRSRLTRGEAGGSSKECGGVSGQRPPARATSMHICRLVARASMLASTGCSLGREKDSAPFFCSGVTSASGRAPSAPTRSNKQKN